jgi:hypothetical protein
MGVERPAWQIGVDLEPDLCRAGVVSPVPVADEMLANKLLLETDERRFLATAHRFRYR